MKISVVALILVILYHGVVFELYALLPELLSLIFVIGWMCVPSDFMLKEQHKTT